MALYKTTKDQNVDTTRQNPIHYWDLPRRPLDRKLHQIRRFCKKKQAVNILNTLNC